MDRTSVSCCFLMPLTAKTQHRLYMTRIGKEKDLRYVVGVKVNDGRDEVVLHDDGANVLPVKVCLAQKGADGLQGQFDGWRRAG